MKISSKAEMYALQSRGLLGNYLPTWGWADFLSQGAKGNFGFRHRTKVGSPLFKRGFDRKGVLDYVRRLLLSGKVSEEDILISQDTSLFDDSRTLQGEVSRTDPWFGAGLTLAYSGMLCNSLTCREEVRQSPLTTLTGVRAAALLQMYMDAGSYDFVQEALTKYADSVVEFTCFSRSVGVFGTNTIVWEVRTY